MSWNDTVCVAVSNCNHEASITGVSTARSDWAPALTGKAAPVAPRTTLVTQKRGSRNAERGTAVPTSAFRVPRSPT